MGLGLGIRHVPVGRGRSDVRRRVLRGFRPIFYCKHGSGYSAVPSGPRAGGQS